MPSEKPSFFWPKCYIGLPQFRFRVEKFHLGNLIKRKRWNFHYKRGFGVKGHGLMPIGCFGV